LVKKSPALQPGKGERRVAGQVDRLEEDIFLSSNWL